LVVLLLTLLPFVVDFTPFCCSLCVVLTQGLGAMHEGESEESERARDIFVNFEFVDGDDHVSKIPVFAVKSRGRQRRLKSVGRTRRLRREGQGREFIINGSRCRAPN
jgi:hypothetical protein